MQLWIEVRGFLCLQARWRFLLSADCATKRWVLVRRRRKCPAGRHGRNSHSFYRPAINDTINIWLKTKNKVFSHNDGPKLRKKDIKRDIKRNRKTDRKTERQTDRQTERQTERKTDRKKDRQKERKTERKTDRKTDSKTDSKTVRQTERQQKDK